MLKPHSLFEDPTVFLFFYLKYLFELLILFKIFISSFQGRNPPPDGSQESLKTVILKVNPPPQKNLKTSLPKTTEKPKPATRFNRHSSSIGNGEDTPGR